MIGRSFDCRILFFFFVVLGALLVGALLPQAQAALPGNRVDVTEYIVTIKKVELCTDSSCSSSVVLGSGDQNFDIAGVNAGAEVGSYANTSGLPIGQTFTHVRVTISATLTVTATGNDNGGNTCYTKTTPNTASGATTLGNTSGQGAPAQSMSVVIPDTTDGGGGITGGPTNADYATYNMVKADGGDPQITYPLTAPFTVGAEEPTITVKFDTKNAFVFVDTSGLGGSTCSFYPFPPVVTITIE